MMIIKESNVTIHVKSLDVAVSFYESIGLVVKNRWENYYAQVMAPGITIGLHPSSGNSNHSGNVSIGFSIDNIDEARSLLQRLPIPITERQEEGGQFLHFNDPDGTSLYFIKSKW